VAVAAANLGLRFILEIWSFAVVAAALTILEVGWRIVVAVMALLALMTVWGARGPR
jgi:steroid 5-alpha reductase family enzyme